MRLRQGWIARLLMRRLAPSQRISPLRMMIFLIFGSSLVGHQLPVQRLWDSWGLFQRWGRLGESFWWTDRILRRILMTICPYQDQTCPCNDGGACHYQPIPCDCGQEDCPESQPMPPPPQVVN